MGHFLSFLASPLVSIWSKVQRCSNGRFGMDGDGIRLRWASLPDTVSWSSSPPWDPISVERRPYGCSLPGLAGFDHEEVTALPSESAPPPPARWGRMSWLTARSSAWSRLPLAGVNGPPHRSISGYRKRPASQSPTTAQCEGQNIRYKNIRKSGVKAEEAWNSASPSAALPNSEIPC